MNGAAEWDYNASGLYSIHGNHVTAKCCSPHFRTAFVHILSK